MNVLQHGQSVHKKYLLLLDELNGIKTSVNKSLSEFFEDSKVNEWLLRNQLPIDTMKIYHWYHDCGKPDCITFDAAGKRHFPNHAAVSSEKFKKHAAHITDYLTISELMSMDMDFHTKKGDELIQLCKHKLSASLFVTALSEICANAEMFGGFDSTSFKIKRKHLYKCYKQLKKECEAQHG